jgi:hypothetical protein
LRHTLLLLRQVLRGPVDSLAGPYLDMIKVIFLYIEFFL